MKKASPKERRRKAIRVAIAERNYSMRILAERAGCSTSMVAMVVRGERGQRGPVGRKVKRTVARALGLRLGDLWPKDRKRV